MAASAVSSTSSARARKWQAGRSLWNMIRTSCYSATGTCRCVSKTIEYRRLPGRTPSLICQLCTGTQGEPPTRCMEVGTLLVRRTEQSNVLGKDGTGSAHVRDPPYLIDFYLPYLKSQSRPPQTSPCMPVSLSLRLPSRTTRPSTAWSTGHGHAHGGGCEGGGFRVRVGRRKLRAKQSLISSGPSHLLCYYIP